MIKVKFYSVFLLVFLIGCSAFSQSRKQLESQQKKLKLEIAKVNNLLFDAKKKERSALEDLKDINQKINVRTRFIKTINLQAKLLSKEIKVNERKLKTLNKKLADLKTDYAEMIFKSYKSKSQQSKVMFVLSSQNFYQAYKRLEYIKQYTAFRKKQGEKIVIQKAIVKKLNDSLVFKKQEKDKLILVEKDQKEKIEADKKKQERLISTIKKKEKKYRRELKKKLRAETKIAEKIDKIIKRAITTSNKKVKSTSVTKSKKKNEFILSPEAKVLATNFESNKGKLPWPVLKGHIIEKFGTHPHPSLPKVTVNNNGIDIRTEASQGVLSIFEGVVVNSFYLPTTQNTIIIKHGEYFTVYSNLKSISVGLGDKVSTNQKIGVAYTSTDEKVTTVHLEIWKSTNKLDPQLWIKASI